MQELIIIGVVAVLLFGKRLPEVAKSLGKSYSEFRRGLSDIQSHMDVTSDVYSSTSSGSSYSDESSSYDEYDDYDEATAPKFEPPPAEPQEEPAPEQPSADTVGSASEQQNRDEENN